MSKTFKRCLSIFLSVLMLVSAFPVSFLASAEEGGYSESVLAFNLMNGEDPVGNASVTLYSNDKVLASGTTSATDGYVAFNNYNSGNISSITKVVIVTADSKRYVLAGVNKLYNVITVDELASYASDSISAADVSVMYGETAKINASSHSGNTIKYKSGNDSVVTVDQNGNVTGNSVGSATVYLSTDFGNGYEDAYASVNVTVTKSDKAISFTDSISNATLGAVYTYTPEYAAGATGSVTYSSSDTSVATVVDSTAGKVKLVSNGSAVITATFTPDSSCTNYTVSKATYTISSDYVVTYAYDNVYTNSGSIVISGADDNEVCTFSVNNEGNYLISGTEIDIAATSEIKEGSNKVAVYINSVNVATFTVKKDISAPSFTLNVPDSAKEWNKKVESVKVYSITDDYSPVESIKYVVNGSSEYSVAKTAKSFEIADDKFVDGINNVIVTVTDEAGNDASASFEVKKDTKEPEFTFSYDDNNGDAWINNTDTEVEVLIADEDNASGIKSVEYIVDPVDGSDSENGKKSVKADNDEKYIVNLKNLITDEGSHTVKFIVTDEADNKKEADLVINYDASLPEVSLSYEFDDEWINSVSEDLSVDVSSADSLSGIDRIMYRVDNGAERTVENGSISISDLNLSDGSYILYVYAIDNAGNSSDEEQVIVKIDTNKPVVHGFDFEEIGEDSASVIMNTLTYGKFFSHGIKVTVELSDNASGIDDSTVKLIATENGTNDTKEFTASSSGNGSYVFIIESKDLKGFDKENNPDYTFKGSVSVYCSDNATNDITVAATDENSDTIGEILWEQNKPVADISVDDVNGSKYTDADGNDWFDSADITLTASDADSGIREYSVTVNGTVLKSFTAETADDLLSELTIKSSDIEGFIESIDNGMYAVEFKVVDAAGNSQTDSYTYYVDASNPFIIDISFDKEPEAVTKEGSDEELYYFGDDTTVTVTADDNGINSDDVVSSLLTDITYKTVDLDGKVVEETLAVDEDGKITFSIPKDFSGSVSVYAVDNVGRRSREVTPATVIFEDQNTHDNAAEKHIVMTLNGYKENCSFNGAVSPVITITDTYAGIKDVSVTVTGGSLDYDEKIVVAKDYDGWTAVTDENDDEIVKSLSKTFDINENCNNIVITVVMTDNCGNTSEAVYKFNIDSTAPVIESESYASGTDTVVNDYWYGGSLIYSATVVERDFDVKWNFLKKNADGEYVAYSDYEVSEVNSEGSGDSKKSAISYVIAETGEYKVSGTIIDKAGNSVAVAEKSFGVDNLAPVVESVLIDNKPIAQSANVAVYDGSLVLYNASTVSVKLNDTGSGLKGTVDYSISNADSDEAAFTGSANVSEGEITINIPADFRGQKIRLVIDPCDECNNSTSYDVLCWTIESAEDHNSDGTHIEVVPDTDAEFSDKAITLDVTMSDSVGIARVDGYITYDGSDVSESICNEDASALVNYGWTALKTGTISIGEENKYDADVYTKINKQFVIDKNANNINVTFILTDYAGNTSTYTRTFNIDTTVPTVSGNITCEGNNVDSFYSSDVTLNLSADEMNFDSFVISATKDGEEYLGYDKSSETTEGTVTSTDVKFTESGYYEVSVVADDLAGNESTAINFSFTIDTIAPVISSVIFKDSQGSVLESLANIFSFGIFKNDTVSVEITAEDNSVDVKTYKVWLNGYEYTSESNVIEIADDIENNTLRAITVQVIDSLGNSTDVVDIAANDDIETNAVKTDEGMRLLIEQNAPVIDLSVDESAAELESYVDDNGNKWYSDDVNVVINLTDEDSGIKNASVSINGKKLETFVNNDVSVMSKEIEVNTSKADIAENGTYTVVVNVTDNAGNDSSETLVFYKDSIDPVIKNVSVSAIGKTALQNAINFLSFGTFYNDDIRISVSASDQMPSTGIKQYTLNIGEDYAVTNTDGNFDVTFDEYFSGAVSVTVVDNIGNSITEKILTEVNSNVLSNTITLENKAPEIEIGVSAANYGDSWYSSDTDFNVEISDTDSGIREYTAKINGYTVGEWQYYNYNEYKESESLKFSTASEYVTADNFVQPVPMNSDGSYIFEITVTDNAGNTKTAEKTVYVDKNAPVIDSIDFEVVDKENSVLNILTFGIFANNDVTVTVNATDGEADNASATGVCKYILYIGEDDGIVLENTTGVFTISYEQYFSAIENGNADGYQISAQAVDNAGNVSTKVIPSVVNGANTNGILMLEKNTPEITISVPTSDTVITNEDGSAEVVKYYYDSVEGKHWYSGNIDFKVEISDPDSGISDFNAELNRVPCNTDVGTKNEKQTDCEFFVSADPELISANTDGSYVLFVNATDNAGNKSSAWSVEFNSDVFIDSTAPEIERVVFSDPQTGNEIPVGDIISFDKASGTYVINCQEEVEITFYTTDLKASSGLNTSTDDSNFLDVEFTSVDGSVIKPVNSGIRCSVEKPVQNWGTTYYVWSYTLPADFKGSVTAVATDNVGHSSEKVNAGNFVVESPEMHSQEKNHITMSLPGYTEGYYFNHTVTPVITVNDLYSGIRDVEILITAEGKQYKKIETVNMTASDLKGWVANTTDLNHVTSAYLAVPVSIESNNIVISVTMTDNSGNISTQKYKFNIDLTNPVITCTLDSSATPNNRYYSEAVTANIRVVEHNFDPSQFTITEGAVTNWSNSGDVWTGSVTYATEGSHQFTIAVTDKAGNKASNNGSEGVFYVDATNPTISVVSMANNQATNADDVQFTITASDTLCLASNPLSVNFTVWYMADVDGVPTLSNGQFSLADLQTKGFIDVATSAGSTAYTYTIKMMNTEDLNNDGIYSFTCSVTDMSGRTSNVISCSNVNGGTESVSAFEFSLNRNGSTYAITWADTGDSVGSSTRTTPENIVITEMNVNDIESDAAASKITISNGIKVSEVSVTPDKDSNEKYGVYTYTIPGASSSYSNDGTYKLRIESVDAAGNVSDGSGKNYAEAAFVIDSQAPVINTDLANNINENAEKKTFTISVEDLSNCILTILADGVPVPVTLESGKQEVAKDLALSGATKSITLELQGAIGEITIDVADSNGLSISETLENIAVSTNPFTRFINRLNANKWSYAIIIGVPVLLAAFIIIVAKRRKKDDNEKTKAKK